MLVQNLSGPGLGADITLPPLAILQAHDTFELDFKLSCLGSRDTDCPIWDHTVQLFVCCDDPSGHKPPCDQCDPTVWSEPHSSSSSSSFPTSPSGDAAWEAPLPCKNLSQARLPTVSSPPSSLSSPSPQCGRELGRWITPFRFFAVPPHFAYAPWYCQRNDSGCMQNPLLLHGCHRFPCHIRTLCVSRQESNQNPLCQ